MMERVKFICLVPLLILTLFFIAPVSRQRLYPEGFNSIRICDRSGALLREVLSFDHKTSVWIDIERISPWMIRASITREDQRFLFHPGVDPCALIRALYTNIKRQKIVSGGSTITMQVAKMALGLKGRSIAVKILEALYALKLDLHLSKAELLEIYLNRIPYGNQIYGVEAAARFYFGKSSAQLSLSESCMLAVIPSAPSLMNPYVHRECVDACRGKLLDRMLRQGAIDRLVYDISRHEQLNLIIPEDDFEAPHFVDHVLARLRSEKARDPARIITTIDLRLQQKTEKMLNSTLRSLNRYAVGQGAVMIADVRSGEILAMVGSRDYFDVVEGQVNGCTALRQPGSTMKPFLYGLALMSGMSLSEMVPDTIMEFRLRDGTVFAPRNYGETYHGPTRMREALASSFNVAAVHLLDNLGVERFHALLRKFGFQSLTRDPLHYGLALGLGAGEVTLLELVNGYRTLASQGSSNELVCIREAMDREGDLIAFQEHVASRAVPVEVAYLITNVLSDNSARLKAFGVDNPLNLPFACAVKTGTSKDYRDNWCVGYTSEYVVGVWVGNFSGAPMQSISGITGSAPLFRDIMIELHKEDYPAQFPAPAGVKKSRICLATGMLARTSCENQMEELFLASETPHDSCNCSERYGVLIDAFNRAMERPDEGGDVNLVIVNPRCGDIYKIDPHISSDAQQIKMMISACDSIESVRFVLDGDVICVRQRPFEVMWPAARGEHVLEAVAIQGTTSYRDRVSFKVY